MREFNFSVLAPFGPFTFFETGTYTKVFGIKKKLQHPLNIEFEIQSYEGSVAMIPGYIRVYNLSADFYANAEKFVRGYQIELRAGVDTRSVLAKKIGYTPVFQTLLVKAEISNLLGNFSSTNPYVDFFFVVDQKKALLASLTDPGRKADEMSKEQLEPHSVSVPPKVPFAPFLVQAVKKFTDWIVAPEPLLLTMLNPSTQTILIMAKTLGELLWQFKKAFGVEASFITQNKTIVLSKGGSSPMHRVPLGAAIIRAEDLLAQPERLGPDGNTISVVTRLRADITLGSIVFLIGAIPSTAQLSSGMSGGFLSSFISTPAMFQLGAYRVTACTHKGSFYNMSPEGWCTMFTAVPYGGQSLLR